MIAAAIVYAALVAFALSRLCAAAKRGDEQERPPRSGGAS